MDYDTFVSALGKTNTNRALGTEKNTNTRDTLFELVLMGSCTKAVE